ncbi:IPTL-CTERM sorting domain-containing protein [Roseobacter weihaiensis]|uniref:IPTL-CTERM sorting domain-containing protein n=1 Tax=Roseobacter weihaiensis TaxID=2763262 RepID=UPI001D0B7057|nr:IPTL-CTERM sorting domain-containing protein [Roseobacter sp. H9]
MKRYLIAAAAAMGLMGSGASAATLSGEFWDLPANTISNIDQAIAAVGGGADPTTATFDSSSINYGDAGANFVIGSLSNFLQGDAGSISGSDPASMQESVFRISGLVTLADGDQIDVTSDDGFRLIIGGNTLSEFTGIRAPNNTTSAVWGGGAGTFQAELWYFEGQFTQAQLQSNLTNFVTPVPLPAGMVLMMTALGGFGIMRRRRKS